MKGAFAPGVCPLGLEAFRPPRATSSLCKGAQFDLTSYETLAQMGLLVCFASVCSGGRLRVSAPSWFGHLCHGAT